MRRSGRRLRSSAKTTRCPSPASDQGRKRRRLSPSSIPMVNFLDSLPDDLLLLILRKLTTSSTKFSDLLSFSISCKRFYALGRSRFVLAKVPAKLFGIRMRNWCDPAHRFLKLCADAGNAEACYVLGMIRFYCLDNRTSGSSMMARAALSSHAPALYSLGIIQFNGSGRSKNEKDLRAGVALCARAATLGYVPAIREVGHCLQDGYGVRRNVVSGRRFLVQADARELAAAVVASGETLIPPDAKCGSDDYRSHIRRVIGSFCTSATDFLWNLPVPEAHPANRFLVEWFATRGGSPASELKLCSLARCGRPETRANEFRRCSVCGFVNYCSRSCQALDWRIRHKSECLPLRRRRDGGDDEALNPNPPR